MIRSALGTLLDLPFTVASRTVDLVGEVSDGAVRRVSRTVIGIEDRIDRVNELVDNAGELVDDVGEFVEDGADLIGDVVGDVVEEGQDLVEDALGVHRRIWEGPDGHAHIEVRGIERDLDTSVRVRMKNAIERLDAVQWAEVNAITRRVVVAFDPSALPVSGIVSVIEGVEAANGIRRGRQNPLGWDTTERADHPADIEPVHRAIAVLVGNSLALGTAVTGRLVRAPRVPVEFAAITSIAEHLPTVRRRLESLLGKPAVDLVLPLLAASANGMAQGPVGIVVDIAHHASSLTELQARRRVWERREPHLYADPSGEGIDPPDISPRPVPLPPGPVEQWAARTSAGSLAAAGAVLVGTGDLRWSADMLLAGIPKAARLGREGFATQLGRTLAARGVVPLDGSALRRLDRIDTVVLDSATLLSGRLETSVVIPLDRNADHAEQEQLEHHAARLVDALESRAGVHGTSDLDGVRVRRYSWSIGTLESATADDDPPPRGTKARIAEVRRSGAVALVLRSRGRAVAVVGVIDRLDPGATMLVESVRNAGLRLIIAGRNGRLDARIDHDGVIPAGRSMGPAVRELQRDGAVVAVVARRGTNGLSAADVGINVARASGRPSWGGDLLCGPDLSEATFLIDACAVAAEASRRSALFAVSGSAFGAVAALTGPRWGAGSRALMMVNGAAAMSLASGTWAAIALARRPRVVLADPTPWHELAVTEVLRRLESAFDGLTSTQARYRQRSTSDTESEATVLEPFLAELANPLNPVLGAGAALAAIVGSTVDAALVAGLIGVNTVVGGAQRLRTERTLAGMLERGAPMVNAIRDGRTVELAESDLVPGDIVVLEAGDVVPADCRIVEAVNLEVDESSLTGESMPLVKSADPSSEDAVADRTSMLFEDTIIAAGDVRAVVVATGAQTETSRSMAAALARGSVPTGGVEFRLRELTQQIIPFAAAAAGASVLAGTLRRWPIRDVVGTGVSLAIASVPEGLPFIATAAQLASVRRLAAIGAVVRAPGTIEALGRVDVLCFDKTGTLTEGRVRLHAVSDGHLTTPVDSLDPRFEDVIAAALRATSVEDDARLDLLDRAIVEVADDLAISTVGGQRGWEASGELPFEASRGMHVVLGRHDDGHVLSVKGAPESILPHCRRRRIGDETHEFDRAEFSAVSESVERLAAQGYRVLAVAERVASDRSEITADRVRDLDLVGLLAFSDPVRPTAAAAVRRIRAAGVESVMITGDHPTTAEAIAAGLGMLSPVDHDRTGSDEVLDDDSLDGDGDSFDGDGSASPSQRLVVSGADLDRFDDDELDGLVEQVAVFARMTPAQKVRVVESFQRVGRVVAMTGDGANDAPAIRLADVGLAMGQSGTSAARDAADLIVVDDRLETIVDALAEGRAMWGSVRSAIGILVGGNLGEIGFTVVSSLFSRRAPMNARQFLLVNLVTDLAPALAVAVRPPVDTTPETLLREGPERSLGESLDRELIVRAVSTAAGATAAWSVARFTGTRTRASTVGLVALVGTQLGQTLVSGGTSPTVVLTSAGSAAALFVVVQTPFLSQFFGCRPLGPLGWATATTAAAAATAGSVVYQRLSLAPATDHSGPAVAPSGSGDRLDQEEHAEQGEQHRGADAGGPARDAIAQGSSDEHGEGTRRGDAEGGAEPGRHR